MEATMTKISMAELAQVMLTENTGSSVVDSGGIYGRAWQRNQGRDFEAEPTTTVQFDTYRGKLSGYRGTVSLYHWLKLHFEPDDEMQAAIDRFAEENPNATWFDVAQKVAENLSTEREPGCTYTYNEPDNWDLSQDIQFWEIYAEDDYEPSHLIVMVHGGCDARWGFTKPYALKIKCDEYQWRDSARIDCIYAGDMRWTSDGGYGAAFVCDDPDERDFFTLPVINVGEFGDEYDRVIELAEKQKKALYTTSLSDAQINTALEQMTKCLNDIKKEFVRDALERIETSVAILIDGKKVVALIDGEEHEISVGNGYL